MTLNLKVMLILLVCTVVQGANANAFAANSPPNILLIIADDLGVDALSSYGFGNQHASTPALDRLAETGVAFTNFWATPACTTTRGALITGQHGFESGIDLVPAAMAEGTATVQQRLKAPDIEDPYVTGVFGKWHLGGRRAAPGHPLNFGIDRFAGNLTNLKDYFDWELVEDGRLHTVNTYHTTKVTDLALAFIRDNSERPWFAWVAYSAPHRPFHNPPKNLSSGNVQGNETARQYRSMVEAMDAEIGRLLAGMPSDTLNNTLVLFLGDNGTPARARNVELFDRDHVKGSLYEGGIRTPLIVAGGPVKRQGAKETAMVNATDIFATIVEFASSETNPTDIPANSISFRGLLDGSNTLQRNYNYSEFRKRQTDPAWTVRDETHKLIVHSDGRTELFEAGDVSERSPIDNPARVEELRALGQSIRSGAAE